MYPNRRRPITPQEERNAEAIKKFLLEHANDYAAKAAKINHPQAKLFEAVAKRISEISDPYWFLDRERNGVKPVMNEVAKEIMAAGIVK